MFDAINRNSFPPEQRAFASRVAAKLYERYGRAPRALVITYGCQQNVSDSERIKGILTEMGYTFTDTPEDAELILYNTCAVRGHAEDRVYGNVGAMKHYKRRRPGMILAVCGCMAQQDSVQKRLRSSFPYVDLVFGTQVQHRLPEFIYRCLLGERVFESELSNGEIVEDIPVRRDGDIKGFLPVMRGCNNFCTYCIVPYVRGRERSRAPEDVLQEAKQMVEAGYKEIMLLGQNVNSYGKGEEHGVNFARLLRMINDIDGDFRIKFMTSHPKDCTVELLDAIRDCEKAARHLHLPFQSGSDRILKAMNRHYDRAKYLELISAARERIPDIALTTDIIVGFPGETYEDFKQTLELVERVKFTSLFTFIYSPREGTPAAAMPDPVSREEKGRWFTELLRVQEKIGNDNLSGMVGRDYRVLCEGQSQNAGYLTGHTDGNITVEFEGSPEMCGKLCRTHITSYDGVLKGTLL